MLYISLKALHIIAVIIWIGGTLVLAVIMTAVPNVDRAENAGWHSFLKVVRHWDERITTPAMVLVWILGLSLAFEGGWFGQPWLMIKLTLVVALSGLHGVLSGGLRRMVLDQNNIPKMSRYAASAIIAAVCAIVSLVTVKPF